MKARLFIQKLTTLKLNKEQLRGYGLSDQFIEEQINEFNFKEREVNEDHSDEILVLLTLFDMAKLNIGAVNFNSSLNQNEAYFFLGYDEANAVVCDKNDGRIKLIDHEDEVSVLVVCAVDGASYLGALYLAKEYYINIVAKDGFVDDQSARCDIAEQCAELAGGPEFLDYYKSLMGCFS